jgi:copper homeostasis protein
MLIEICCFSLESAISVQRAGADRVELCGGMAEGGTTPSAGLIKLVRQHLTIPFTVMIRPRGGDFLYTDTEIAVMQSDIETAKNLGVDGVVLGILNADGTVDETTTRALVALAHPLPVTFHRAFDLTRNPHEALEAVIEAGCVRLLTSGQQPTAEAGLPLLRELVKQANKRIEIMAGAGINPNNAALFADAGLPAMHLTGKRVFDSTMTFRRNGLGMGSVAPGEYERVETDEDTIRAVILSGKG